MTIIYTHAHDHRRALKRSAGYSVRPLASKRKQVLVIDTAIKGQAVRAFQKISDPANARLFSAQTALDDFADIEV